MLNIRNILPFSPTKSTFFAICCLVFEIFCVSLHRLFKAKKNIINPLGQQHKTLSTKRTKNYGKTYWYSHSSPRYYR